MGSPTLHRLRTKDPTAPRDIRINGAIKKDYVPPITMSVDDSDAEDLTVAPFYEGYFAFGIKKIAEKITRY